MGQREYDDFKRRLRKWMESHPADYERFENMMIAKDDAGYRLVLQQATMLIPQFRKALRQKAGEGLYELVRRARVGRKIDTGIRQCRPGNTRSGHALLALFRAELRADDRAR